MKCLHKPTNLTPNTDSTVERVSVPDDKVVLGRQFIPSKSEYTHQFFKLYEDRLAHLKPRIISNISKLDADVTIENKILNVERDKRCIVVGTIFKHMPLKPSVLKEYTQQHAILLVPSNKKFVSSDDIVYLEDEGARVKLEGECINHLDWITGVVVGLLGVRQDQTFTVEKFIFPKIPIQKPWPLSNKPKTYVMLVSGLSMGNPSVNPLYYQLLYEFIVGNMSTEEQIAGISKISRVIIGGNSLYDNIHIQDSNLRDHSKKYTQEEKNSYMQAIQGLDSYIAHLARKVHVDIIPGPLDPSNYSFPQQPLNHWLFPKSAKLSTATFCTNPYMIEIDDVLIQGNSGQPYENALGYIEVAGPLEYVEKTLRWGHAAPMAPNTLSTYSTERDLCVIGMLYRSLLGLSYNF